MTRGGKPSSVLFSLQLDVTRGGFPLLTMFASTQMRQERGKASSISGRNAPISAEGADRVGTKAKHVIASTAKRVAGSLSRPAATNILVRPVEKLDMGEMRAKTVTEAMGMRPKYLRHNLWAPEANPSVTVAEWTESALPLARPPLSELNNASINQTLHAHPDLFRIVTPLDNCVLERLSASHPNCGFVESVLAGLREGFWPWANTRKDGYHSHMMKLVSSA
jgi:hypothetical protein